jgi:uncharacterized protein (TIGR02996 family)
VHGFAERTRGTHAIRYASHVLVATYHLSDTERVRARRQWIDAQPILVGRAADCHVVLDDPEVAPHHLRLSNRDGQIVVENLVDELTALVDEGEPVRIGGTILKIRLQAQAVVSTHAAPDEAHPSNPPPPRLAINPPAPSPPPVRARPRKLVLSNDPQEQSLVFAVRANPSDGGARMVYADWLEQNGFEAKVSLVRLREHLDTFLHKTATDVDWRAVAVRTPIDHCRRNKCPGAWDALVPSDATDFVRKCATCRHAVRYCVDRNDVRASAYDGAPVVFDAALDRIEAHAWYKNWADFSDDVDEDIEDDPDGYTVDAPPSQFRR